MNIITGHTGEPHVRPEQDCAVHQGLVGEGAYILRTGNSLTAEVASANEIRILDGVISHQGCLGVIEVGTYDTLAIANGTQGMLRKDLIVCRYTRSSGIESLEFAVIQGTPAASNPQAPTYNEGEIASGDSLVDIPVYQVNINGINITSVDRLLDISESLTGIMALIGSVAMGTTATTVTGAIAEIKSQIPEHIDYTWQYAGIGIGANLVYSATKNIARTGYTPTGIKGYRILNNDTNGKNASWCVIPRLWVYGNSLDFSIWNLNTTQSAVVKIQIKVEYVSNNVV